MHYAKDRSCRNESKVVKLINKVVFSGKLW